MNGFYDTNWDALMDKVEFKKSEEDGRLCITPLEGGLSNKSAVRKCVYPLTAYDTVIACTGWKFDKSFADDVMPEMTPETSSRLVSLRHEISVRRAAAAAAAAAAHAGSASLSRL